MSDKKVPELRFPGFSEDWKDKKISKLLDLKNGVNASKEDYGSGIKFINVLDILENNFITFENIQGSVNIPDEILEKNSVTYGDILFQRSSETREEVGTANVYLDSEKVTFGGFVIRGKKIGEYDPFFFKLLLSSHKVRKEITSWSGGSTRYNIGQESLGKTSVLFPSLPEQQKIAAFLSDIDKKIELLTRKKELMEQYKKGMLQKLFSRELRFKDENGEDFPDWEEKKLGEIISNKCKKYNCKNEKEIRCIELEHLESNTGRLLGYTSSLNQKSIKNYFPKGAILFGKLRPYLKKFHYADEDGVCSSEIWVLNSNSLHPQFLYFYIQHETFLYHANKSSGSKMPRADWSIINEISDLFPDKKEQEKIASFLSNIDIKIEFLSNCIEKITTTKKGLLQRMFI